MPRGPFLLLFLVACGTPSSEPIDPIRSEAEFRARRLSDAELKDYVARHLQRTVGAAWDLEALTLAAFYYHPDLDIARARLAGARAALETASAIPNPTAAFSGERDITKVASPWLYGVSFDMPIDFLWKRGWQMKGASQLSDAARLELGEVAWQVRRRLRASLADVFLARLEVELRKKEEALRGNLVIAMERRLAVGETFRLDVDQARAELSRTRVLLAAAKGHVAETRGALAQAIGVPPAAIGGVEFAWDGFEAPPGEDALSLSRVQEAGLLNRLDVRRALAEVAAAEAALGLERAKRYPDVTIGPGYLWDHGEKKFTLGLSVTIPIFNQNGGPIAEAEARRREAAARFAGLQAQAIGEMEQALARFRSARSELEETDRTTAAIASREKAVRRQVELGEADRVALLGLELETAANAAVRLEALRRAQESLGSLEDSVQRPLGPEPRPLVVPEER